MREQEMINLFLNQPPILSSELVQQGEPAHNLMAFCQQAHGQPERLPSVFSEKMGQCLPRNLDFAPDLLPPLFSDSDRGSIRRFPPPPLFCPNHHHFLRFCSGFQRRIQRLPSRKKPCYIGYATNPIREKIFLMAVSDNPGEIFSLGWLHRGSHLNLNNKIYVTLFLPLRS